MKGMSKERNKILPEEVSCQRLLLCYSTPVLYNSLFFYCEENAANERHIYVCDFDDPKVVMQHKHVVWDRTSV